MDQAYCAPEADETIHLHLRRALLSRTVNTTIFLDMLNRRLIFQLEVSVQQVRMVSAVCRRFTSDRFR